MPAVRADALAQPTDEDHDAAAMNRLLASILGAALLLAACGGESEQAAPSPSPMQSKTETPEPSESTSEPTPEEEEVVWPYEGYPKVVPRSKVPAQMRWTFDGSRVVAVAPGVWTDHIPGLDVMQMALEGAPAGYCAAVEEFQRFQESQGVQSGMTCW